MGMDERSPKANFQSQPKKLGLPTPSGAPGPEIHGLRTSCVLCRACRIKTGHSRYTTVLDIRVLERSKSHRPTRLQSCVLSNRRPRLSGCSYFFSRSHAECEYYLLIWKMYCNKLLLYTSFPHYYIAIIKLCIVYTIWYIYIIYVYLNFRLINMIDNCFFT